MKNLKYYLLAALCTFAATTFTSCNDDDDNNNVSTLRALTDAEKALYSSTINGTYNGYLLYVKPEATKVDSIATTWTVDMTESKLRIPNFPVQIIGNMTYNEDVKALLQEAGEQELTANVYIPEQEYNEFITAGVYRYTVYPTDGQMKFTVNDKTVAINFYTSILLGNVRYAAMAAIQKGEFTCNLIVRDVAVDYQTYSVNNLLVLSYVPNND
ncbi:MAG: DUF4840 domain-containing protein [Prevotella sp.]|nr:DUF4840 domain-containing protein [Prevotella sp.]